MPGETIPWRCRKPRPRASDPGRAHRRSWFRARLRPRPAARVGCPPLLLPLPDNLAIFGHHNSEFSGLGKTGSARRNRPGETTAQTAHHFADRGGQFRFGHARDSRPGEDQLPTMARNRPPFNATQPAAKGRYPSWDVFERKSRIIFCLPGRSQVLSSGISAIGVHSIRSPSSSAGRALQHSAASAELVAEKHWR